MNKQRQNVSDSEDLLAVNQRNTRSKTSTDGGEYSVTIPVDLLIDISLRLPGKSIARCRCVSKLWASTMRLPYFTELFLTRSLARPRLLFYCIRDGHMLFFSSPEPQNFDGKSSLVTADSHMKIPCAFLYERLVSCISGLVFTTDERILNGKKHQVSVVCNPSTGQSMTLPKVKSRRKVGVRSYFGYDPIDKQHKVLAMTCKVYGIQWKVSEEHQVLTLGTSEPSWKRIDCCVPHSPYPKYHHHKCINGVLYYPAVNTSTQSFIIVCFDVKSEMFRFVEDRDDSVSHSTAGHTSLIGYNGKLGRLRFQGWDYMDNRSSIRLRVLEDAETHEWSDHEYALPALWQKIVGVRDIIKCVRFLGVTRTNEIVMSSSGSSSVLYYNRETKTVRRAEMNGMEEAYTFLDCYVEDVKLM
ncbi:unnamed protein product [Microthlaspi erraticum]|uniref:F-box domain-containing protein n=1 Tax=Microthlaspi erraticum TaxID=1685480 RepID=A0A6D2HT52_9BRAS|nr:unnamed protein product [Microthlaspi erraticum]